MTRPDLTLVVPPTAPPSASLRDADWQESAERHIANIDKALSDGPADSPWRGCLFILRRLLAEQAGASPLRRVDQSDYPSRG